MQRVTVRTLDRKAPTASVHIGKEVRVAPAFLNRDTDELHLPESVLKQLGLQPGQALQAAAYDHGRHLHVGPLLGFMLGMTARASLYARPALFRQVAADARQAGMLLFFFDRTGVNLPKRCIRGWVEREGDWESIELPFPDVIYNRDTYSNLERRFLAASLRRELALFHGVAFVNSVQSFPKWAVHEALRFFPETARFSPETARFGSPADLRTMLARHATIYLKADQGSRGESVIRIQKVPGGWHLAGRRNGRFVDREFKGIMELQRSLLLMKLKDWVIQQGIEVIQAEGRSIDFRVILQKDRQGEWSYLLTWARLAASGEVVCSVSQGGEVIALPACLARFPAAFGRYPGLEAEIERVGLAVAEVLETQYGSLGEVGLDLGLDREGHLWVFEANTKPRHRVVPGMSLTSRICDYALYLGEQGWEAQHPAIHWSLDEG